MLQSIHSAYLFDSILSKILLSKLVKIKKGSERTPINSSELILGIQQLGIYTKLPHKRQNM